jgi:amidohydrolase
MMSAHGILDEARALGPSLIELRRSIHRYPELAFEEERTSEIATRELASLGLEVDAHIGGSTAVVGTLRGGMTGPSILLRADMDALNIQEETGLAFASERSGLMHACGHDAHTAMLIGAARLLATRRDKIVGSVRFLFQPGEENASGARFLIEHGLLDDPATKAAFALHVDPNLLTGRLSVREGPVFASCASFTLEVVGKGGHPGLPHQTVDAIIVAAQIVQALQVLASRETDPREPFTLGIGMINGGSRPNVIADRVELAGTMRAFDEATLDRAIVGMERIAHGVAEAFRGSIVLKASRGLPSLVNDAAMARLARGAIDRELGEGVAVNGLPLLASEDFALVAERVPSAMLLLGVGGYSGENFSLHHPRFDINEEVLPLGAAALASIALAATGTS